MNSAVVLCVDVGNSQTVIGIYRGADVVEYWRLPTPKNTTSDEIYLRVRLLIVESTVGIKEITHIGLSSVVPALERIWIKALGKFLNPEVQAVGPSNCLDIPLRYDMPKQLGADRICNVIAMKGMGLENAVAIDLGTATTFDILKEGGFYGGLILPGISSALEVLTERAMRLMPVSLEWTPKVVATNSEDSLRSGILHGYLGQILYLIEQCENECGPLHVIGTGGWGNTIGNHLNRFDAFDPYLSLKGIRRVAMQKRFE